MGKGWTIAAKFAKKIERRRLGALAVLFLESVLVSVVLPYNHGYAHHISTHGNVSAESKQVPTDTDWFAPTPELAKTDRILYPYSVIPGGVRNSVELRKAVARDEVVARHYSEFDLRAVRVARLEEARAVFVSGDQQAGMQAFMAGKVRVQGDMTKLMMAQAGGGGANPALTQALQDITE